MAAYKYWGLRVINSSHAFASAISEIELREFPNGPSIFTGGVADATDTIRAEFAAAMAVDGDLGTQWQTNDGYPPTWWYEFPAPVSAVEYAIYTRDVAEPLAPTDWELVASDDGVNWDVIDAQSGIPVTRGEWSVYSFASSTERYAISGLALFSDGAIADTVRLWHRTNAVHVIDLIPDSPSGAYITQDLDGPGPYDVLILRDGYRPLAHGPITAMLV